MPCLLVFSFGWSWEFVSRAIVSRGGISEGDLVVLVAPVSGVDVEEERYRGAVEAVRRFLLNVGGRDPVEVRVDVDVEFEDLITSVSRELSKFIPGFTYVEFYLIGGMRVLILALLFVASMLRSLGVKVKVYCGPETLPKITRVPLEVLEGIGRLTERQVEVLRKLMVLGEAGADSLGLDMGVDPSTSRRLLEKLYSKGFVEKSRRGPRVTYRVTGLAKALIALHDNLGARG